jgi:arabinogalactan endo-1,4-beta-galactosidase
VRLDMRRNRSCLVALVIGSLSACSGSDGDEAGGARGSGGQSVVSRGGGSAALTGGASTAIGRGGSSPGLSSTGSQSNAGGRSGAGSSGGLGGSGAMGGANPVGGARTLGSWGANDAGGKFSAGAQSQIGGSSARTSSGSVSAGGAVLGGATARGGSANAGDPAQAGGTENSGGARPAGGGPGMGGSSAGGRGGAPPGNAGSSGGGSAVAGNSFRATFYIGADITDQETASESTRASLLSLLKSHGFNYIRLRTFVDPKASDGYDKTNGYDDVAHTVAFGKQIKDAGMGLLVDFHYSDNWADPGKQCVPVAWQSYTTIAELATALHDYTADALTKLVAGGARPDMVQIGNEITPGMLLHRCDGGGQPTGDNPVTGSSSNWANLGALLKAGVQGVKDVDPGISISFHIDRCGDKPTETSGAALQTSITWLTNAAKYVTPDAFGESCYQRYQGDPNSASSTKAGWANTFGELAKKFPNIKLFAAEYGPMQREINDVLYAIPNHQGIGTFNWEPTTQGDWNTGHDLLRRSGSTYTAQPDLALYDQMKVDFASRL